MKKLLLSLALLSSLNFAFANVSSSSATSINQATSKAPIGVSPVTSFFAVDGKIGFTSARGGVFYYNFEDKKATQIGDFLPDNEYIWEAIELNHNLYVAARNGVYTCNLSDCKFTKIFNNLSGHDIWDIANNKNSLFALDDTDHLVYQLDNTKVTALPKIQNGDIPKKLFVSSSGVYIGSESGNLYKYNSGKQSWHKIAQVGSLIWTIAEVKNQLLLGTQSGDVLVFNGKSLKSLNLKSTQNKAVDYVAADKKFIFASNDLGELFQYDGSHWSKINAQLDNNTVSGSLFVNGNYLYSGIKDNKLIRYDYVNKTIVVSH